MRTVYNRKTSPRVIGGLVQRKNNCVKTARLGYVVDRKRAGKGYKHVLKKKDIHDFTDLVPEWGNISTGIESIVLDAGNELRDGLYKHYSNEGTGVIWLSAWPKELCVYVNDDYYNDHRWHLEMLGVIYEKKIDAWCCHFTESQAKAFMLLHIFLHELGHHIDKMSSYKQNVMRGGEDFAESYANRTAMEIWPAYIKKLGCP